jgi:Lon protease-like protein
MNSSPIPEGFSGTTRLFPLPNLVLFPGVVQGLHIFEQRYRRMMADALGSDYLMSLVLLKPGWEEDYDGKPGIESVACLGRVIWNEQLPDGRYNLRLRGIARARIIEECPTDHPYRIARVELPPETAPNELSELVALRRGLADAVLPRFTADTAAHRQIQELFSGEMSLGQVCDVLSYALPLPLELKQSLLAESHSGRRAIAITDAFKNAESRDGRPFPPAFSPN